MRSYFFICLLLFFASSSLALTQENQEKVVNIYNWSNYISEDILKEFTKETGIKVNYSTYDSNETLYAKLKASPRIRYDIIVPSTYFIDRMRKEGMLQVLDKSKLSHFNNLDPSLLNKDYDPGNKYSIPYFWSNTGIVINTRYPSAFPQRWIDLWDTRYHNQLLLLNDVHEVFSIALFTLGYSPNDTDPQHIKAAYFQLKKLMPNVRLFSDDSVKSLYIDEDLTVGMGWNGDIYQASQENPQIQFIYPKEGFITAIDSMAIPKGAPHCDNAYRFIDFVLRPAIAKRISLATGYASPNRAAVKRMPKAILNNIMIYPKPSTLKRGIVQTAVGEKAEALYQKYWELLKIGG